MSRKKANFKGLIDYLNKEESEAFTYNLLSIQKEEILREFENNYKFISTNQRSNQNSLYHEIISLKVNSNDTKNISNILKDLSLKYLKLRAKNALAYGKVHLEGKYPHIHLIISANELNSSKKVSLSKAKFAHIQREIEKYKELKYPNLETQEPIYNRKNKTKLTQKEQEFKNRTKELSKKEQIRKKLLSIFESSTSSDELLNELKKANLEIYQRANTVSVKNLETNKRYRLKTLGLEEDLKGCKLKLNRVKGQRVEIKALRDNLQNRNKTFSYNNITMNSTQAKQVPMIELLENFGFKALKVSNNDYWYLSPFRDEKTPSFKIDIVKNLWFDFGMGKGGNILDFVMEYKNCNFKEALEIIEHSTGLKNQMRLFKTLESENFKIADTNSIKSNKIISTNKHKPILKSIKELNNLALIEYLNKRGINPSIAKSYLKEAYYQVKDKNYFSLAFKNSSGGYELRNPYFKSSIGSKDLTFINSLEKDHKITIFEGFLDFLSYLTLKQKESNQLLKHSNYIILNSLSFLPKAIELVKTNNFKELISFLDRDSSGVKAFQTLESELKSQNIKCNDLSGLYSGFKDLNDYLVHLNFKENELKRIKPILERQREK